jgi:WD40 repeat protein
MSRIFISHSSKDNASAIALKNWLTDHGWDDVFLDLDAQRGIAAGARWERALNQAALRCEAVLFLVSRDWLASAWCLKEFNLANRLNKRLFGLVIDDTPLGDLPAALTGTWQLVHLSSGRDHEMRRVVLPNTHDEAHVTFSSEGLRRLRVGLERAGLDARFFAWPPADDPRRSPYRGLQPLEAADAGIFFGRDAPIIEALDKMRGIKEGSGPRLLTLLGASGAGKSSFLRAGLWPRLQRDDLNFFPLPIIRPEHHPISGEAGLLRSVELAFARLGAPKTRAEIRQAVEGGARRLGPLLQELNAEASRHLPDSDGNGFAPMLVLGIDQGEELFSWGGNEETAACLEILRDLISEDQPAMLAVIAIRSDAYEQLQTAKVFEDIPQRPFSLAPMPKGAYQAVIEGPALRSRETDHAMAVDPALTQALLDDIEDGGGRDALPLLAFTLERLYLEYGARGRLLLEDYLSLGRIGGSIEAAIDRAFHEAEKDSRIPRAREARLALLRRGLIPWLAGIDPDTGSPRRQKARLSEIPDEARPLIDLLVEQRLLSTDRNEETSEQTIEPAHEALLRQWGSLQDWLREDFGALASLETLKRAARDWLANDRSRDWLAHRAGRLEDADRLLGRSDLAEKLDDEDKAYLEACRAQARAEADEARRLEMEREKERSRRLADAEALAVANRRATHRAIAGLVVALFLTAAALATLVLAETQRRQALVSESQFLARASRSATSNGDSTLGILLSLAALPKSLSSPTRPVVEQAELALEYALSRQTERRVLSGHTDGLAEAVHSPNGSRIVTASYDHSARLYNALDGSLVAVLNGHRQAVLSARFSRDGSRLLTASFDGTVRLWDAETGQLQHVLTAGDRRGFAGRSLVVSAEFSPDGKFVAAAFVDTEGPALWDAASGKLLSDPRIQWGTGSSVSFSADSRYLLTASSRSVAVWDLISTNRVAELSGAGEWGKAVFSPDGRTVVATTASVTLWDWRNDTEGERAKKLAGHSAIINTINFAPDSKIFITASNDGTARTWSVADFQDDPSYIPSPFSGTWLRGHQSEVRSAEFSPGGDYALTASADGTARIWWAYNGAELYQLRPGGGDIRSAHFSPDGQSILTASTDGSARLYDVESRLRRSLSGPQLASDRKSERSLLGLFALPESRDFLTISVDGSFNRWDSAGKPKRGWRSGEREITAVALSPDGRQIATSTAYGVVNLQEVDKDNSPRWLDRHDGQVNAIAFSPDGKRIATASDDGTAHIVEPARRFYMQYRAHVVRQYHPIVLRGHTSYVTAVSFSPDGSHVLTIANDRTARLWNAGDGSLGCIIEDVGSAIDLASFSPDGLAVLTADSAGQLSLRDLACDAKLSWSAGSRVTSMSFVPDGSALVSGTESGRLEIWNAQTGASKLGVDAHRGPITSLRLARDGSKILTTSDDGAAKVWNVADGRLTAQMSAGIGELKGGLFAMDDDQIVVSSATRARIWNYKPGQLVATLSNRYYYDRPRVSFAHASDTFVTWSRWLSDLELWSPDAKDHLVAFPGQKGRITSVSISSDDKKISTTSSDRKVRIWNSPGGPPIVLGGHEGRINSGFFSPANDKFISASADGTVRIYAMATGETLKIVRPGRGQMAYANFSPDGSGFVTISEDGELRLWNSQTGEATATSNLTHVSRAEFSSDSKRLIVFREPGSDDANPDRMNLMDVANARVIATLTGTAAQFSPDGETVLTTDSATQTTSMLWSAADGRKIAELNGGYARFSNDGSKLVTQGLDDRTRKAVINLWDSSSTARILQFPAVGPPSNQTYVTRNGIEASHLAFSHDGRRLAMVDEHKAQVVDLGSGVVVSEWINLSHSLSDILWSSDGRAVLAVSIDGAVIKWPVVRCDAAVQAAETTLPRDLSAKEREEFFLGQGNSAALRNSRLLTLLTSLAPEQNVCAMSSQ